VATIKYNDAYHINFFLKVKVACGNVNSSIIINFLTKPTLSIDSNKNVLSSVNDVATITVDNESDTEVL
jgi:hypothetical protein